MDKDVVPKIATCISVVAVLLSAATLYVMLEDEGKDPAYTFYIGMDADSTDDQVSAVESAMKELISVTHGSGYTYLGVADGGSASGGAVAEQRTLVFVVAAIDGSAADSIADAALAMGGVEAVMVEESRADIRFL